MTRALSVSAAAVLIVLGAFIPAWAGAPTDTVRQYTDSVIKVLEDPTLKQEEHRAERRAAVRKIAIEAFDVQETARRALGQHWQARTPAERQEFVQLFADLLESTYISRIDLFGGERIRFTGESIDGDTAVVHGRVITHKGTEVPVDARMLRKADRWYIYDILIENVSLVGNYRAQFDRIIRTSSYGELVRRLKSRNELLQQDHRDLKAKTTS